MFADVISGEVVLSRSRLGELMRICDQEVASAKHVVHSDRCFFFGFSRASALDIRDMICCVA